MTHTESVAAAYEFTTLTVSDASIFCLQQYADLRSSSPTRRFRGSWNTKVHESNCLICQESSKVPARGEGEVVKSWQVYIFYVNYAFHSKRILKPRAVAKTADLIIMMLDATKSLEQRRLLEIELDAVGIRLNKNKPDVVFKKKTTGGVS